MSPEYPKVSFNTYPNTHMLPSPSFRACFTGTAMLSISCEHVRSLWLDFLPLKLSQKEQLSLCKCSPGDGHRQSEEHLPSKHLLLPLGLVRTERRIPISFKNKENSAFKNNKVYYIHAQILDLLANTDICKSVVHRHQF